MTRLKCPKCGSGGAFQRWDGPDLVLHCLCGLNKVMETTLQEIVIPEKVSDKARVRLPKVGSRLYKTLAMLAELDEPNSGEVAARLQARGERFTVSEASTCLTVLMGMKLVYRVHARKNLPGGSVWALTDECTDLMEQPDGT